MHHRALGPAIFASLVAFALAPMACSSNNAGVPAIVTNPPNVVTEAGSTIDGSTGDLDGSTGTDAAEAGDAAPIDLECTDKILNGNETDVDCGGPKCPRCIDGKKCVAGTDCSGNFCETVTRQCSTPNCTDKVKNGTETDTDCGGGVCGTCGVGRGCKADSDCATGKCDTASNACACPARMITVSKAAGGAYCMDETEITNGDYDRFIRANVPATPTQQPTACAGNITFSPEAETPLGDAHWPPAQPLSTSFGLPIRNVDWCDALAYCKWAGKVLCGDVAGQPNAPADANTAAKDAWFNACSAQQTLTFPYGNSYDTNKCYYSMGSPGAVSDWTDTGTFISIPVPGDKKRSCHGGAVGLFQASGNVAEWENSCDGTGETANCLVRGGSYASASASAVQCNAARTETRLAHRNDVGIRCCQF